MHSISKQFYCVVLKNTKAKKENIRKKITTGITRATFQRVPKKL